MLYRDQDLIATFISILLKSLGFLLQGVPVFNSALYKPSSVPSFLSLNFYPNTLSFLFFITKFFGLFLIKNQLFLISWRLWRLILKP